MILLKLLGLTTLVTPHFVHFQSYVGPYQTQIAKAIGTETVTCGLLYLPYCYQSSVVTKADTSQKGLSFS